MLGNGCVDIVFRLISLFVLMILKLTVMRSYLISKLMILKMSLRLNLKNMKFHANRMNSNIILIEYGLHSIKNK